MRQTICWLLGRDRFLGPYWTRWKDGTMDIGIKKTMVSAQLPQINSGYKGWLTANTAVWASGTRGPYVNSCVSIIASYYEPAFSCNASCNVMVILWLGAALGIMLPPYYVHVFACNLTCYIYIVCIVKCQEFIKQLMGAIYMQIYRGGWYLFF